MSAVESLSLPRRMRRGPRVVRVALAGCGVVGGELVRLLAHSAGGIAARHGVRLELASVLVRDAGRPRPAGLPRGVLTTDLATFLATDAALWVEAIGGTDPPLAIARHALGRGARLVTANKALLAVHGPALAALARRSGGRIDFESAVAGGIPVVRALRDSLAHTGIHAVRGVLNGTTNFILTRLAEGWRYPAALAEAQARGFAEASPARDLSGEDAADKLRLLAWLAFGVAPQRLRLRRRGLAPHPERLAADAAWAGGVPRLLAEAVEVPGGVAAAVEPVIVAAHSALGRTRDEENAVLLESQWNGSIRLTGPGAGGNATATAVLADMLRPATRQRAARVPLQGVDDPRPHRWVLSVPRGGAGAALDRTLARAVVPLERVSDAPHARVALTLPVPWARVDLALRVLEAGRAEPVVSRYEP